MEVEEEVAEGEGAVIEIEKVGMIRGGGIEES